MQGGTIKSQNFLHITGYWISFTYPARSPKPVFVWGTDSRKAWSPAPEAPNDGEVTTSFSSLFRKLSFPSVLKMCASLYFHVVCPFFSFRFHIWLISARMKRFFYGLCWVPLWRSEDLRNFPVILFDQCIELCHSFTTRHFVCPSDISTWPF